MSDNAIRPSHYCDGRQYEPIKVIQDWKLDFCLGNALKYIARAGKKDDIIQDLKKARQYIDFEIASLEEDRQLEKKWVQTNPDIDDGK